MISFIKKICCCFKKNNQEEKTRIHIYNNENQEIDILEFYYPACYLPSADQESCNTILHSGQYNDFEFESQ